MWIHAVSVGEVKLAVLFLRRWQQRQPDQRFVLTTTTTTGYTVAMQSLPRSVVVIFSPLDLPWTVGRALRAIQPDLLVIFEVEVWPNLLWQARAAGVRTALVNCRMSDSSARGYAWLRWFFRPLFESFSLICTQSEEDSRRVRRIVHDDRRVRTCWTMKFDQAGQPQNRERSRLLTALFGTQSLLWTAASTHPGEEEMVLDLFCQLRRESPGLRLLLAPRHHERAGEVAKLLRGHALAWTSLTAARAKPVAENVVVDVLLVDTTGDLEALIAGSDLVYVGKSMCGNHGGHNIIEPAVYGKVVLHGPAMENFRQVATIFQREQAAIQVANRDELLAWLRKLVGAKQLRDDFGLRAYGVVERYRGAINKTLDYLFSLPPGAG